MKHLKKALATLLSGALLISVLAIGASASAGDVNRDGNVDMKDVLVLRKHIANLAVCNDEAAADMNSDSSLDMKDVLLLRLFIVNGTLSEEPTNSEAELAAERVVEIINQERAAAGLSALQSNPQLEQACALRLQELKEKFSHTRPDDTSWATVFDELGIARGGAAENIAKGYKTPEDLMSSLMTKEGHRNNILNLDFTYVAVGFDPETKAWIQLFMKPVDYDPSKVNAKEEIQAVVKIVNQRRAEAGLPALTYSKSLQKVADLRAKEITELFSHTRPNGQLCFTAFGELGVKYSYAGENIASGYKSAEAVMTGWMNSEGHRKNILDSRFTEIAVGFDPETRAWVQVFRKP